jgi:NACHT domain
VFLFPKAVCLSLKTTSAQDRREICNWLEHTNPNHEHNLAHKLHEVHTCQWILRLDAWKRWLDFSPIDRFQQCSERFIWIHGIPGAGKTVLASYLVTEIQKYCLQIPGPQDRHACLYYYCSYRHSQDEAVPFLSWIVSQLCRQLERIPGIIAQRHNFHMELTITDLECALETLLDDLDVVYVILDAVDESSPRDDLLLVIESLVVRDTFAKLRLLATSREYIDIENTLRPTSASIPMSNPIVDEDIRRYVSSMLRSNKRLARWPRGLVDEILEALVHGAKGM